MEFYVGLALLGGASILLLRACVRGRVGQAPYCRSCGFELSGLMEPARCPECGKELSGRNAFRIGQPRINKRTLWFGISLAGLGTALVAIDSLNIKGRFNITSTKPAWLLQSEAYLLDGTRSGMATLELQNRGSAGELSLGWDDRLLKSALSRDSQSWRTMPDPLWNVIVDGMRDGKVDSKRIAKIIDDSNVGVQVSQVGNAQGVNVYPSETLYFNVREQWTAGDNDSGMHQLQPFVKLYITSLQLVGDSGQVYVQDIYAEDENFPNRFIDAAGRVQLNQWWYLSHESAEQSWGWSLPHDFEPGEYTAKLELGYECLRSYNSMLRPSTGTTVPGSIITATGVIESEFRVVVAPFGSNDPIPVSAEELDTQFHFSIIDKDVMFGHTPVVEFEIGVHAEQPPVWMVGELVFTQRGLEHRVEVVHNGNLRTHRRRILLPELEVGDIHVRYEHSESRARQMRRDIRRVLDGPIDLGTHYFPTYQEMLIQNKSSD